MYVITENESNIVLGKGGRLDYMSNGYPMLVEENTAYPTDMVTVHKLEDIPQEITSDNKYCYTEEKGFYLNPNYEEPNEYGIPNDLLNSIIDDYTMSLYSEGVL